MSAAKRSALAPAERTVDVEWRAFEAGVKPAFRVSAAPSEIASIVERYAGAGASVAQSDVLELRGKRSVIAYVARSQTAADSLRDVEQRLFGRPSRRIRRAASRELGLGLGYPRCCVDAFIRRNHGDLSVWLSALRGRKLGHDRYLGARDARVPRPRPPINPLLMPEHRTFISFEPCRYDCPQAMAIADRIVPVVADVDAEWVAFVEREQARAIVVASSGARAHVELGRDGECLRILAAEPPRGAGRDARSADARLASAIVGSAVDNRGLLQVYKTRAPPVLIDFSADQMG